jgi:hypothetical protein
MDLRPDMMGDQANDPFTVRWRQALARVRQPVRQPVDPDAPIRIEQDLDDARIFEPCGGSPGLAPCAAYARRVKPLPAEENLPP